MKGLGEGDHWFNKSSSTILLDNFMICKLIEFRLWMRRFIDMGGHDVFVEATISLDTIVC